MLKAAKKISVRVIAILVLACIVACGASTVSSNSVFTASTAYASPSRTDKILDDMYREFRKFLRDTQRDWYNHQRNVTKDYYADKRKAIRDKRRAELEAESIDFRSATSSDFNRFVNNLNDRQYEALQKLSSYAATIGVHEVPCSSNAEYSALKSLCNKIDGYHFVKGIYDRSRIIAVQIERYW